LNDGKAKGRGNSSPHEDRASFSTKGQKKKYARRGMGCPTRLRKDQRLRGVLKREKSKERSAKTVQD